MPIHKKGDVNKFSNYRPVSVLPAFSKIIEKLVYTRIKYFLNKHNILYAYQFGFRKNMSTSMALNTLVHKFHDAINNDNFMIGIFLDLSRAFDTISHDILFADDTNIFISGKSLRDISIVLHNELNKIDLWLKNNKQSINVTKSKYMIMASLGKKYNPNRAPKFDLGHGRLNLLILWVKHMTGSVIIYKTICEI